MFFQLGNEFFLVRPADADVLMNAMVAYIHGKFIGLVVSVNILEWQE